MKRQPRISSMERRLGAVLLLLASGASAVRAAEEEPVPPAEPVDLRGVLLVDYDCKSEINRRQLSLFANGTVRLRTEGIEESRVRLAELSPDELQGFINRLKQEDLGETDRETWSPGGDWIERCRLDLTLPERERDTFLIDRFASLSLALSRVLAVVKDLDRLAEERSPPARHLPAEYRPKSGDVLERADGERFRVVGYTMDKLGVELEGLDLPLTVFIHMDDLRKQFLALVPPDED